MENCITSVKRPPIGRQRESPNHCAALAACLFQNEVMLILMLTYDEPF